MNKFGKVMDNIVITITILYNVFVVFACSCYAIVMLDSGWYVYSDFNIKNIWFIIFTIAFNVVQMFIRILIRSYKK